jgi:hypothetical protein
MPTLYRSIPTPAVDTHTDIVDMFKSIGEQDLAEVRAKLEKRTTWTIKCSTNYLAYKYSCGELLENMSTAKTYIGDERAVHSYGNCHLTVGPYHGSATDFTYYRAHG